MNTQPLLRNQSLNTSVIFNISDMKSRSMTKEDILQVNNTKSNRRVNTILDLGYKIEYLKYRDYNYFLNIQMIDTDLPRILPFIILEKNIRNISNIPSLVKILNEKNPMKYNLKQGHKFYEYKLVNFLKESIQHKTLKKIWSEVSDETQLSGNTFAANYSKFIGHLKTSGSLIQGTKENVQYERVYFDEEKSLINLNFQFQV